MDDLAFGTRDKRGNWAPSEPLDIAPFWTLRPSPSRIRAWRTASRCRTTCATWPARSAETYAERPPISRDAWEEPARLSEPAWLTELMAA